MHTHTYIGPKAQSITLDVVHRHEAAVRLMVCMMDSSAGRLGVVGVLTLARIASVAITLVEV